MTKFELPGIVRSRVVMLGEAGARWLEQLDETVAALAVGWGLQVGRVLNGGSNALVAEVVMPDGAPAILKVAVPDPELPSVEAKILAAADGHGYARLYHHDPAKGAMVLERLGPPLWSEKWPQDHELEVYCAALREAWKVRIDPEGFTDGAGKAAWLEDFIPPTWESLERPCSERTVALAMELAARRRHTFDPARSVICHGDAHPGNLLGPLTKGGAHKFIDPEGAFMEPEYDLGCWLRGWRPAQADEPDVPRLAREAAHQMAELTGTNAETIWEWGFIERVSSGLLLAKLGHEEGALYLRIAEQLAEA